MTTAGRGIAAASNSAGRRCGVLGGARARDYWWRWLWGPVGLIQSTPLTLCLVVLGRHVKQLEFLNVLFGDRPALTRVENFYQRVLAGDPDEVQEHAE